MEKNLRRAPPAARGVCARNGEGPAGACAARMNPLPLVVLAAALAAAPLALPTAAAGPCDNPLEEVLCTVVGIAEDNVQAVRDGVQHLCDHWLHVCEVSGSALP